MEKWVSRVSNGWETFAKEEKNDFPGEVFAYICTYDWPGPSGLCVAEALACAHRSWPFTGEARRR